MVPNTAGWSKRQSSAAGSVAHRLNSEGTLLEQVAKPMFADSQAACIAGSLLLATPFCNWF